MKRILNLILLALGVIAYTSCDNDEGIEYIQKSSVKIVSRDVNFPASASQGSIVVEAPSEFTVSTSDKGWCTTTISGSTIQVNVEQNLALEGRSSMLTIRCGADTACVAVVQSGVIFELGSGSSIGMGNEEATYSYDVKCNTEFTLTPTEDWITANYDAEEGKLNISVKKNTTGHLRRGTIAYSAGQYEDVIKIMQYDFNENVAGDYMLFFTDSGDGERYYFNATFSKSGNTYGLDIPDIGFTIPVTYDPNSGILVVKAGQYMGIYNKEDYIYTTLWDTNEGYLTWDTGVGMTALFQYLVIPDDQGGQHPYTAALFEDEGSWGTYKANAIRFEAFTSKTLSGTTRKGSILNLIDPILQREETGVKVASSMTSQNIRKAHIKLPRK